MRRFKVLAEHTGIRNERNDVEEVPYLTKGRVIYRSGGLQKLVLAGLEAG